MKKIIIPVLSVFLSLLFLASCKENKKKLLARTWKVEDIRLSDKISDEVKAEFKETSKEVVKSLRLTYNADGSCIRHFAGKAFREKWASNEDFSELTVTDENGRTLIYKILTLSKDSFVYQSQIHNTEPTTYVLVPSAD